ncbi:MAG: hypothetical protein WBA74_27515 [Cyclobacteriaceae bacterium]
MKDIILQQHLNAMVGNISSLRKLVDHMSYEEFRKEEHVKETAYSYLQEIGQIANEITANSDQLEFGFDIKSLVAFSNARYNQEAEMAHRSVWAIIKNDLADIADEIEHSSHYNEAVNEDY